MSLDRRAVLAAGTALAAGLAACGRNGEGESAERRRPPPAPADGRWGEVIEQFRLSPDKIHMSALLIASHPAPVREAIERHRTGLDEDPVAYVNSNNRPLQERARGAAGRYLGLSGSDIALTDSTTMGLGLVYNGLRLRPGQEILFTEQDYYVTYEAAWLAAERMGARVRRIPLYDDVRNVGAEALAQRLAGAIAPHTRVLGLTWVHSSTGLKLPLPLLKEALAPVNARRSEADRVIVVVDGVHGFGNQDFVFEDLGCDFFVAGCHKWLFGPRGTGIVAARDAAWRQTRPTIPSFIDDGAWGAWLQEDRPSGPVTAERVTPGGFKAFEHQWAMGEAFEFHERIGKAQVAQRTAELAGQLKEGLAGIAGVQLWTPVSPELSAGIVSFDIDGMSSSAVVSALRERGVVASVAPYATPHARLTPSIRNTPQEIEAVLREVRAIV